MTFCFNRWFTSVFRGDDTHLSKKCTRLTTRLSKFPMKRAQRCLTVSGFGHRSVTLRQNPFPFRHRSASVIVRSTARVKAFRPKL